MPAEIRDYQPAELTAVHAINESAVPHVTSIPPADVEWFAARASYLRAGPKPCG